MKIEKILLPFDGSVHSVNAANYALNLAKLSGAHVTVMTCYELHGKSYMPEVSDSLIKDIQSKVRQEAEKVLERAGSIFAQQEGVECQLETVGGAPGNVLARLAKSKEFDLIIMGSHGHSDIAGMFLGSVTHKVLNTIYCPVLIVP